MTGDRSLPREVSHWSWFDLLSAVATTDSTLAEQREPSIYWDEIRKRASDFVWVTLRRKDSDLGGAIDAEDVIQEVLMRLSRPEVVKTILQSRNVSAYMAALLRNSVRNALRRSSKEARHLRAYQSEAFAAGTDASSESRARSLLFSRLNELIIEFPESDQQLLRWRFWEGRDISWIAVQIGTSYSATAVRMFRLMKRLRQGFE